MQFPPAKESGAPLRHRTDTLDDDVVLDGELWLLVEGGDVRLAPGDRVVVRGVPNAWENRSDALGAARGRVDRGATGVTSGRRGRARGQARG